MRLVFWNCNMAFHRKHVGLTALCPDVAVISECARMEILGQKAPDFVPSSCVWVGENDNKGLAVFTFGDLTADLDGSFDPTIKWTAPVKIRGSMNFNMLGVWANHHLKGPDGHRP